MSDPHPTRQSLDPVASQGAEDGEQNFCPVTDVTDVTTESDRGTSEPHKDGESLDAILRDLQSIETQPDTGGQLHLEDGQIVHVVPAASDKLLFVSSRGTVSIVDRSDRTPRPDRSSMSADGVRRFSAGEDPSLLECLNALWSLLEDHVAFPRRWHAPLIAIWIAGTYCHRLFRQYGYLNVVSPTKGCGKTTLLTLISETAFNATGVLVTPSDASLFFECNSNSSTQVMDEVDPLWRGRPELQAMINGGFQRGASVTRRTGEDFSKVTAFRVYSPRVLAGVNEIPDMARHRSFRIQLARKQARTLLKKFDPERSGTMRDFLRRLRDDLHISVLRRAEIIRDYYLVAGAYPFKPHVDDRLRDMLRPLLAIAFTAGRDQEEGWSLVEPLVDASKDLSAIRAEDDLEDEQVVIAIELFCKMLDAKKAERMLLRVQDVEEAFWSVAELRDISAPTKWLRTKLGFNGDHLRPGSGEPTAWLIAITREALLELRSRYGVA